jgi:hypothetical protein
MALEVYEKATLFLDSTALTEWQEGTVELVGNYTPVETMFQGGSIRGFVRDEPLGMNADLTERVRRDGTEYQDLVEAWRDGTTVTLTVWIGGVQFSSEGKINMGSLDGKAGTHAVNFVGAKPEVYIP